MAHHHSPKAVVDNLEVFYDATNTFRSYKGEPTTNIVTTTPSQGGWGGTYSTLSSEEKSFRFIITSWSGTPGAAWRSYLWDVSAYTGQNVTISATFESANEATADFSWIMVGQTTGTQTYLGYSAGSQRNIKYGNTRERISWSGTVGDGQKVGFTVWADNGTGTFSVDVSNVQIEIGKSHPTPFVNGTRASTAALLDMTGNRTLELSGVSFNANAEPEFDGSNDLITFGGSANIVNKSYTIEAVFNRYSTNRVDGIIGDAQYHWFSFYVNSSNQLYLFHRRNSPYTDNGAISATGLVGTGYHHAIGVFDINAGMRVYLNGQLVASNTNTTAFDLAGRGPQYIGQHRGGAPSSPSVMSGQIPLLKIHLNKAFTPMEVEQSYLAVKSRFGI
jgi:hypothetical protein